MARYALSLTETHSLALVTGDRTLVDVVVHELTHSYFGNGVTFVPLPSDSITTH